MNRRPGQHRGISAGTAITAVAVMGSVAAVAFTATPLLDGVLPRASVLVLFFVLIATGEFLRVTLPGDRDAAPVGAAMALAMALLPEYGRNSSAGYGAGVVISVVALATVVGVIPHAVVSRAPRVEVIARRIIGVSAAAFMFRELPLLDGRTLLETTQGWTDLRWAVALGMLLVALVAALIDVTLAAAIRVGHEHARLRPVLLDELRAWWGIGTAIGVTGVLIALAVRPMGLMALPVFVVPLLLTQFAFRRYAFVRGTYRQTIRSLSQLTELGGYTETGHSRRVSALATAMGRDLGLDERSVLELEYAALMHDIGQLSLADPIPGGATVMAASADQQRIASLGADIVRQTGVMDRVATVVERQADPYRRHGEDVPGTMDRPEWEVPIASRIIRVANAFDDLVGESTEYARQTEALQRIHLGMAFDYDPQVVTSLTRVVARGGGWR